MSNFFSWRSAFQKSDLPPTTKLVLFCISTYMNDHGEGAFPSIRTLMKDTSLSNRAVILHIKKAQEEGYLKVSQHGLGGQAWKRNEYKISIPKVVTLTTKGGDFDDTKVVTLTTKGGDPNDQKVVTQGHTNTPYNSPYNSPTNSLDENLTIEMEYQFLDWWQYCPNKVAPNLARKEFGKAMQLTTFDDLVEKMKLYADHVKRNNQKHIMSPHNWLAGHRWDDELPEKPFDPIEYLKELEAQDAN